jgi:type VI secretion system protein ImpG
MRDELYERYEDELRFLRRTGAEFAKHYPKIAGRLLLEPTKCDDPHVERLLEGFAFLAARVHLRIEDDFPEFSEAILELAYPHYTRPIPSMSLVEFHLDPAQGKLTTGYHIPREKELYSRNVEGTACRFRTCYDTTLWPVRIASAKWLSPHELSPPVRAADAVAALRVELQCATDIDFANLEMDRLRLHVRADPSLATTLYELLCNNCVRILARDPSAPGKGEPAVLPATAIRPVGFDADEGILPLPRRAFVGYRLLQEYFTFPDKFFFLDIEQFDRVRAACPGSRAELIFLISSFERADRRAVLEQGVTRDTLRLGCTPVVNLFERESEPVQMNQRRQEYLLVPDARRRKWTGIFSVESVKATSPGTKEVIQIAPFHSFKHVVDQSNPSMFWVARRRPSGWRQDRSSDIWLSFVDLSSRTVYPEADTASAKVLCHNADLPSLLPFGDAAGDFEMQGGGPVKRIVALVKPTEPVHPPLGKPKLWKLISQLSLNYMSLQEGGAQTLRELLRLHDFAESPAATRQIQGVLSVKGTPVYARIDGEQGMTFARGHRVEIEFDEEEYAGGGVYLMASVLERFLGLYVSLNSFCILAARTRQRKELVREWAPRSGWKALI